MLSDLRERRPALQVWSAGCSDGAELYSLAMLLRERDMLEGSIVLGTDCRADALTRALRGVFDVLSVAPPDEPRCRPHATLVEGHWHVAEPLRAALRWRTGNVLALSEPGPWDVLLCRNLAIYLEPDAAAGLWRRLEASLRRGGLLVVGRAERPVGASRALVAPCIYRRETV